MMSVPEPSKTQVLRSIDYTNVALKAAAESSVGVSEASDIPRTFAGVAKHLPLTATIFTSLETHLKAISKEDENQDLRDEYPSMKKAADDCYEHARTLQILFEAVTESEEGAHVNLASYRTAVNRDGGKRVEKVMLDLLNNAASVAKDPFVTDDQQRKLQEALKEVKKLPPSLDDVVGSSVVMNHNGSGNQFHHGGKGNQNVCHGGLQVTGENQGATYNFGNENQKATGKNEKRQGGKTKS